MIGTRGIIIYTTEVRHGQRQFIRLTESKYV